MQCPEAVPSHRHEGPLPNRFDAPWPHQDREQDCYSVRYAGSTIRGCLMEVLAWGRNEVSPNASARQAAVQNADGMPGAANPNNDFASYAERLKVAELRLVEESSLLSVHAPDVQAWLERQSSVRSALRTLSGRLSFDLHVDQAIVRLSGPFARAVTQACSARIRDEGAVGVAINHGMMMTRFCGRCTIMPTFALAIQYH
jgi:hypothetical protein